MVAGATVSQKSCSEHNKLTPVKPCSHLCDKHNTSDISISISPSTRKKEHVPFFLCLYLCLCHLCYAYRTSVNQALKFKYSSKTDLTHLTNSASLLRFSLCNFCLIPFCGFQHYTLTANGTLELCDIKTRLQNMKFYTKILAQKDITAK